MKIARRLTVAVRFLAQMGAPLALASVPVLAATTITGCADESDPQTWIKRLDDPATKAPAIKRLTQFFEDTMTKNNKDREAPEVKDLMGKIAEPLTKAYVSGGLDDKTRKDLIKLLSDTRDPRTAPALAKAFNDHEMGKTDDDVRFASQSVIGMSKANKLTDQAVIDAVWNTFARFQVAKATSGNLVKDLHDAVLAVAESRKQESGYGPKAVEKLNAPVKLDDADDTKNQLEFWQLTAVQVISEMRFAGAIKTLVKVLLAPSKLALNAVTRTTLLKMAKDADPALIEALQKPDPDIAKEKDYKDTKAHLAITADVLGLISRPAGRDAVLAAIPGADTPITRMGFAKSLILFPPSPDSIPKFKGVYEKVTETGDKAEMLQIASQFYDSSLTDWLVGESLKMKGPYRLLPLDSAIKLMRPAQKKSVHDALLKSESDIGKEGFGPAKSIYEYAEKAVDKCNEDASCYYTVLDESIPSNPPSANMKAIKAVYMASILGGGANSKKTVDELMKRLPKIVDAVTRVSLAQAIDKLTPAGDPALADALDKIVEEDKKAGDKQLLAADDAVVKVALRLRARAQQ